VYRDKRREWNEESAGWAGAGEFLPTHKRNEEANSIEQQQEKVIIPRSTLPLFTLHPPDCLLVYFILSPGFQTHTPTYAAINPSP
jgi:hypothetical protein